MHFIFILKHPRRFNNFRNLFFNTENMKQRTYNFLFRRERFPTICAAIYRDPRCNTLRARFILRRWLRKRKRRVCVVLLLRQNSKDFLWRVTNWRSGVVDLERRSIPQKDKLRMSDVNWLNTFARENALREYWTFLRKIANFPTFPKKYF